MGLKANANLKYAASWLVKPREGGSPSPRLSKNPERDQGSEPPATTSELPTIQALMVRWARCMRNHGLPDFGDPTITADGHRIMHGHFNIGSPAYYAARQACDPQLNRSMAAAGVGAMAPS